MKKLILIASMFAAVTAQAKTTKVNGDTYLIVPAEEALKDHQINQYDDIQDPPQGYVVTLPAGYNVKGFESVSDGYALCSVTFSDSRKRTIQIDAVEIETDEPGCTLILKLEAPDRKTEFQVRYAIEQVGT